MLSQQPDGVWHSALFRRSLMAGVMGLLIVLPVFWIFMGYQTWQHRHAVKIDVLKTAEQVTEIFRKQGRAGVVKFLNADDLAVWGPERLIEAFHKDELIYRVIDQRGKTRVGSDLLQSEQPEAIAFINYGELAEQPIFVVRLGNLRLRQTLLLGRFLPKKTLWDYDEFWLGTWLLVFASLATSLFSAWLTSRFALVRLEGISTTTQKVGDGMLDSRVAIASVEDEFARLGVAVNDMLDRISALTRHLEGVTIGAAHDLKTPVSNLGGRLELMERDLGDPEALGTHIEAGRSHIATLLRTLDAMLRLGEIEAGRRRGAFTDVNISDLSADLAESLTPVFEDADKTLHANIEAGLIVFGDYDLLVQMLVNLLENAVEHTRDGATVNLSASLQENVAQIVVSDDGPGIPTHLSERIFERFHRLESSRGSAGNGLGLSLVKSIAELHEGDVALVSTSPGCVFRVEIPLKVIGSEL